MILLRRPARLRLSRRLVKAWPKYCPFSLWILSNRIRQNQERHLINLLTANSITLKIKRDLILVNFFSLYLLQAVNETVRKCQTPVEKICDGSGSEVMHAYHQQSLSHKIIKNNCHCLLICTFRSSYIVSWSSVFNWPMQYYSDMHHCFWDLLFHKVVIMMVNWSIHFRIMLPVGS